MHDDAAINRFNNINSGRYFPRVDSHFPHVGTDQ